MEPVDKEISDAFEKLNIIDGQPLKEKCSESSEFSIFKLQILAPINHIKDISHNLDAIYDFIEKSTASNIDKKAIKAFIGQLFEQKIIVNKRSQTGKDSCQRIILINDPSTFDDQHIVLPD